jgi:hypothetical protein
LIDFGPPFLENAKGSKDFKFPLETILAMHSLKTTAGELVSHLLPIKGLQDINSAMSTLIGEDFLKRLKTTKLTAIQGSKETLEKFNVTSVYDGVEDAFALRHYFCHEFATSEQIDEGRIWLATASIFIFIIATESLLNELDVISTTRG